jgi:hypothetical protein
MGRLTAFCIPERREILQWSHLGGYSWKGICEACCRREEMDHNKRWVELNSRDPRFFPPPPISLPFSTLNQTLNSRRHNKGIKQKTDVFDLAMAKAGIVGRAILLDYHSWRLSQSPIPTYDSFATSPIPLSQLLACASSQG